jgi:hypothetical protein
VNEPTETLRRPKRARAAGVSGRIAGVYRRQSSVTPAGVMPGANVDLIEAGPDGTFDTGDETTMSTISGLDGSYLFDNLTPGLYRLAGTALPTIDESAEFHFVPVGFGSGGTTFRWTGFFGSTTPIGTPVTLTEFATDGTPIGTFGANTGAAGNVTFTSPYTGGVSTYQLTATIAGHVGSTPRFSTIDFYTSAQTYDSGVASTSAWEVVTPADLTVVAGLSQGDYDLVARSFFSNFYTIP